MIGDGVVVALLRAREAEKEQSLYYRVLAARAEESADTEAAERLNALHADEQHHFARLTARLNELGVDQPELLVRTVPVGELGDWTAAARIREQLEVDRYEHLLSLELDPETRALLGTILATETQHHKKLAGKWTRA